MVKKIEKKDMRCLNLRYGKYYIITFYDRNKGKRCYVGQSKSYEEAIIKRDLFF